MLITPEYKKQQEQMHASMPGYGTTGEKYGETVSEIVNMMGIQEVLDYGCGHNRSLMRTFKPAHEVKVQCYDPGVPEYADPPEPSQMVVCIDVLEHIEPDCIDAVLDHLEELTGELLFATVHLAPAGKKLPDGRNAHLIQKPQEWWVPKFMDRFLMKGFNQRSEKGFEILCVPKGASLRKTWGTEANKNGFDHFG